ncbi:MAG TPA: DUF4189 domain-containing protein [Blastocatellia bacterium]|nr:DUF4189 domain-containing protein [Blastocatellia bacterium]
MPHLLMALLTFWFWIPMTPLKPAAPAKPRASWGAIAYSYSTGRYGTAYDYATQDQAINSAVERCRANDCKAVVWFERGCGSFAVGYNRVSGWAIGNSRAEAESKALAECRKRGGGCHIIAWACTSR